MSTQHDPLEGMRSSQWRAESMQLVHWGGFHGVTSIEFCPTTTLISGASGTGKSTVLDAYLALMMDSNTPFNGASNDAGVGRARGATQRSLLTYLRGKLDDTRENGEATERVLRGTGSWTWGAVAVTFVDDEHGRYTALRLYYVPRSASKDSDITKKLCTIAAVVDLKEFEPLAAEKFERRAIRSRFPAMNVHDSYEAFAVDLHTRLGIGANGDGHSALRLLARIQAGRPVTTVDDLYKSMVLDLPATFDAADRAVRHFTDLEAAYEEMATAAGKQAALQTITDLWDDHHAASTTVADVDALGLERGENSPFADWAARFESSLIAARLDANRRERGDRHETRRAAAAEEKALEVRLIAIDQDIADAGGRTLQAIDSQIDAFRTDHEQAVQASIIFNDETSILELSVVESNDFDAAQATARHFVDVGYRDQLQSLQAERDHVQEQVWPLRQEQLVLRDELESLRGRAGRVPKDWHEARLDAARAANIDPSNLPFVAELIDVLPEHAEWRTAIEVTLNSVARVLLVDERHLDRLSRAIDHLRWGVRINFEGVALRPFQPRPVNPAMLSGKLAYKDTPFTAWIQDRITSDATDALCVPTAADLTGGGRRVTQAGQTRHGQRGAHGRANSSSIIGFDNTARLAEIQERLGQVASEMSQAQIEIDRLGRSELRLTELRDAHKRVIDTRWDAIDHQTLAQRIERLKGQRAEILDSNDRLSELQQHREAIDGLKGGASKRKYLAEADVDALDSELDRLQRRVSDLDNQIGYLLTAGQVCDADRASVLAARFSEVADPSTYEQSTFPEHLARLVKVLRNDLYSAQQAAKRASDSLTIIFQGYQTHWPDPNLGISIDSYLDYLAILNEITATGLHERRQEWVRRLTGWTGEDLVPLNGAFDSAVEDIQDRLAPVNSILQSLPFGAFRDRLRIDLRRLHREDHQRFRSRLRELSSGATSDMSVEQAEARFKHLRAFIDQIRPDPKPGERSQRDYYLDVRKHIELTATVLTADGDVRAEFRSLGEKSGGETQELVAFIVGAALRFQLGDETRTRPRFAPVFLDEGFVKADSEFAGRGVNAWKGLGFQLVIAAPFDKVTALEPHIDQILGVTKSPATGHARITDITGEPTP